MDFKWKTGGLFQEWKVIDGVMEIRMISERLLHDSRIWNEIPAHCKETVDVEKQTDNARVGWHSKSKVKVTFLYKALNN